MTGKLLRANLPAVRRDRRGFILSEQKEAAGAAGAGETAAIVHKARKYGKQKAWDFGDIQTRQYTT